MHDSPHPYPDNAELRETLSVPGAEGLYVAFHPNSHTERGHDVLSLSWEDRASGLLRREGPFSGTAFPGTRQKPPLKVEADSFELHFRSDADTHFWGYRLVAWAAGPSGWCRLAELMMDESKGCERLVRRLVARVRVRVGGIGLGLGLGLGLCLGS